MFRFELRPLAQMVPWTWGEGPHWFGLTDGAYCITAGNVTLFEYSQELQAQRMLEGIRTPYVDYYVARLYEDLLTMLERAAEPLPIDLLRRFGDPGELVDRFDEHYNQHLTDDLFELLEPASRWWWDRQLDCGFLIAWPDIHCWRIGDEVVIRWKTPNRTIDGRRAWSAPPRGEFRLSWSIFWTEVESFHTRLMAAMLERIVQARTIWPSSDMRLYVEHLQNEHEEREENFARFKQRPTKLTNWAAVSESLSEVQRILRSGGR